MSGQTKKHKNVKGSVQALLDTVLIKVSDENLLPKLIWNYGIQNNTQRFFRQYRKQLDSVYSKQLKTPLIYNPEQAKTQREIFKEKILKLKKNELDIEYLSSKPSGAKRIMTYQGHGLQEVRYKTKKEFQIFRSFNQQTFNKGFGTIYDDKLEYQLDKELTQRKRVHTYQSQKKKEDIVKLNLTRTRKLRVEGDGENSKQRHRIAHLSLPCLLKEGKRMVTSKISVLKGSQSPCSLSERAVFGKIISGKWQTQILRKMQEIGGYSRNVNQSQIKLTQQSISRYLKHTYERANRIVDFLEIQQVETFQSYSQRISNLKLMPVKHIEFLAFLFYDSNNDGYICEADLYRLTQNCKRNPLLEYDLKRIRKYSRKCKMVEFPTYSELYRRSQITETTYFKWISIQHDADDTAQANLQLRKYVLNLKKNSVFIDFKGFCSIFKKQKPLFWYDLMWRLSGFAYEGLQYT